ncbi:MAG: M20/M25/M40 family metallo-hydrolase [Acidimicrobiales bacterium]
MGIDGCVLGDELERIGYAGPAPVPGLVPHAFVELHVEQGPVLEAEGLTIGAVTGVQGISWQEITVVGQSNHAGTTPMALRAIPARSPPRSPCSCEPSPASWGRPWWRRWAGSSWRRTSSTSCRHRPPSRSISATPTSRGCGGRAPAARAPRDGGGRRGMHGAAAELARFEPVGFDPRLVDLVEHTAAELGHPVRRMPSGAGHDAQMLARVCPTAMVFTPSVGGLSHNPAEHTEPEDLRAGADVLLQVMLALAAEETPVG